MILLFAVLLVVGLVFPHLSVPQTIVTTDYAIVIIGTFPAILDRESKGSVMTALPTSFFNVLNCVIAGQLIASDGVEPILAGLAVQGARVRTFLTVGSTTQVLVRWAVALALAATLVAARWACWACCIGLGLVGLSWLRVLTRRARREGVIRAALEEVDRHLERCRPAPNL